MNLNTTQIGLMFLVRALFFAFVTPLAGWIGDKTVRKYSQKVNYVLYTTLFMIKS